MSVLESLMENGVDAEDLEKAASARLFINACTEEGIDLEQHSDEEVEAAYESWYEETYGGGEKYASDEEVEEATAKLAEAEILGRHMARAYMDEMEKEAMEVSPGVFRSLRGTAENREKGIAASPGMDAAAIEKYKRVRGGTKEHILGPTPVGGGPRQSLGVRRKGGNLSTGRRSVGSHLGQIERGVAKGPPSRMDAVRSAASRAGGWIKANKGKSALIGLGALGAGAGGIALSRRHRKNASVEAFDDLAEQRAYEILQANGFEFEGETDELDEAVDARAIELLEDAGYSFE